MLILKSITEKSGCLFGDERRRQLPKKGPKLVTLELQQRTQNISEDIKSVSDTIKLLKLENRGLQLEKSTLRLSKLTHRKQQPQLTKLQRMRHIQETMKEEKVTTHQWKIRGYLPLNFLESLTVSIAAYQVTPPVKMLLPSVDLKDIVRAVQIAYKKSSKSYFYFSETTKQNFFEPCVFTVYNLERFTLHRLTRVP